MSDDLIKRLRESRATWSNEGGKVHACPTDLEAEAAAALAEAQAEIARLREELGTFLAVWSVEYARRMGFADGELHPQHFDRMSELGLRMVDFRRAALEAKHG